MDLLKDELFFNEHAFANISCSRENEFNIFKRMLELNKNVIVSYILVHGPHQVDRTRINQLSGYTWLTSLFLTSVIAENSVCLGRVWQETLYSSRLCQSPVKWNLLQQILKAQLKFHESNSIAGTSDLRNDGSHGLQKLGFLDKLAYKWNRKRTKYLAPPVHMTAPLQYLGTLRHL